MASFEESVMYFHNQHMAITTEDDKFMCFYIGNKDLKFYIDLYSQTVACIHYFTLETLYHALNILMECKCNDVSQTCANIISKVNAVVPGLAKKEEDA